MAAAAVALAQMVPVRLAERALQATLWVFLLSMVLAAVEVDIAEWTRGFAAMAAREERMPEMAETANGILSMTVQPRTLW